MHGRTGMDVFLRRLRTEDIGDVVEIEREAFTPMWAGTPFKREISNRYACYLLASCLHDGATPGLAGMPPAQGTASTNGPASPTPVSAPTRRVRWDWLRRLVPGLGQPQPPLAAPLSLKAVSPVVGYVGVWFQGDEAHITEIAVRERLRGNGIGELLLIGSVRAAIQYGSNVVTLEVRVSNLIAQRLYEKYGFKQVGIRKAYYSDNREDAAIMTTSPIHSEEYQSLFGRLQEIYQARWRPISIES